MQLPGVSSYSPPASAGLRRKILREFQGMEKVTFDMTQRRAYVKASRFDSGKVGVGEGLPTLWWGVVSAFEPCSCLSFIVRMEIDFLHLVVVVSRSG